MVVDRDEDGIRWAELHVVALSRAALRTRPGEREPVVLRHARLARSLRKPIVVVRAEPVEVPSWLEGAPVVDLGPDRDFEKVVADLSAGRIVPVVLPPLQE